jgi:hypothetical protein
MQDPYTTLGVTQNASAADIKNAFRRLAKKLHPDANKHDPKAVWRFAEVHAAYEVLGDSNKRKAFDRGEIDAEGKPHFQGGEDFDRQLGLGGRAVKRGFGRFEDIRNDVFAAGGAEGRGLGPTADIGAWGKTPPWRKILLACGAAAIAYTACVHQSNKIIPPIVPGWQELASCSYAVSLDGNKELLLSEDHSATLYDKSVMKEGSRYKDIGAPGTWSFDDNSKKYTVSFGGIADIYTVVSPEQVSFCMLIKGNLESANLRESWFSAETDDPGDYYDREPEVHD